MTDIKLRRKDYQPTVNCQHAGLMLERGFDTWTTTDNQYNGQKKAFYDQLIEILPGHFYQQAYQRWQTYLADNSESCKSWTGKLEGRLYLGLGEANPLESAVTLHHTYGVPFIPGSAIKGVLHHVLLARLAQAYDAQKKRYILNEKDQAIVDTLFGREPNDTERDDSGAGGYIIFHDAWWKPEQRSPLVKEVVTVHHQQYYAGEKDATDFDSPNPNQQLAIRGSFLFSVEGERNWAEYALKLLQDTLKHHGIGAKTTSGYGYFQVIESLLSKIEEWPDADLAHRNKAGMGNVIEAHYNGHTALAKYEIFRDFVDSLSTSAHKKLKKGELIVTVKVRKTENRYDLVELLNKK